MTEISSQRERSSASRSQRARLYRALSDEHRLELVDALVDSDRSPGELAASTGLPTNLVAFHLGVLEEAGVVERRRSEGDARRRYVRLRSPAREAMGMEGAGRGRGRGLGVVFVCAHNSARSQFAEALWRARTGEKAWSAGTRPARRVHPLAVEVARRWGLDLSGRRPKPYHAVAPAADLVVSVCDRAWEAGIPLRGERIHWSVPDPVGRGREAFGTAFSEIAERIEQLGGDHSNGNRPESA